MVEDEDVHDPVTAIAIAAFIALDAGVAASVVDGSAHSVPLVEVFLRFREGVAISEDVGLAFDLRLEGVDVVVPLRRIDEEVLRELVIRFEIIHNPRESLGVDAEARLGVLLRQLDPQ